MTVLLFVLRQFRSPSVKVEYVLLTYLCDVIESHLETIYQLNVSTHLLSSARQCRMVQVGSQAET